jgi:molecular chaperone DnaK (HSP70)
MKIIITSLFICFSTLAVGQVIEQERRMSLGEQSALVLEIPNSDAKTVESVWKSFFGNYGRTRKNRKADEWYVTGAEISTLGTNRPVDVYAQISGNQTGTTVVTWIDMKGGFLSADQYPEQYPNAVKMLQDFQLEVRKSILESDLKEQEKLLSRLESDLKKLMRDNENLHKTIQKAEETIAKARQDIEQNIRDQEQKKSEVGTQQNTVETVKKKIEHLGSKK